MYKHTIINKRAKKPAHYRMKCDSKIKILFEGILPRQRYPANISNIL